MQAIRILLRNGGETIVDREDEWLARQSPWYRNDQGYAVSTRAANGWSGTKLHRHIFGLAKGDRRMVDHINGDRLDNRRANLRIANGSESRQNSSRQRDGSSRFKGVTKASGPNPWRAMIRARGKNRHLGSFPTEVAAARAYDAAALEHFGEFARTNESMGLFQ